MKCSTRTRISAAELESFETFLDLNGLEKVQIGFHMNINTMENFIVYSIEDDETAEKAVVLSLIHGNLEAAYNSHKQKLNYTSPYIVW